MNAEKMARGEAEARKPGRPRDPETERRILEVVLRQLASEGYSRMSVDSVAAEAGASKPTLYRRWAGKADLVTAALRMMQVREPEVAAGSTVEELTGVLRNFGRSLLRPNGMSLVGTVLAEEAHTPELLHLFRERLVAPRRRMLVEILERARARGELRDEVNVEVAATLLVGAFYARYLAVGKIPAEFAEEVAGMVWRGIAAEAGGGVATKRAAGTGLRENIHGATAPAAKTAAFGELATAPESIR